MQVLQKYILLPSVLEKGYRRNGKWMLEIVEDVENYLII
jgi:hypothetical protein